LPILAHGGNLFQDAQGMARRYVSRDKKIKKKPEKVDVGLNLIFLDVIY
jgi:hypothetical protein